MKNLSSFYSKDGHFLILLSLHDDGNMGIFSMVFWNQNDCIQRCIIENGMHFINTPYQASTLDQTDKETLVINSSAFDCVTYVEYILALSLYHCKKNNHLKDTYRL